MSNAWDRTALQAPEAEPAFWPAPVHKPAAVPETNGRHPAADAPTAAPPVRLIDLCEPLFQYVCRLSQDARRGQAVAAVRVRADVKELVAVARARASAVARPGEPSPLDHWRSVEMPMLFFVDFRVRSLPALAAVEWDDLARQMHREMAGDEKFFDLLEAVLADPSEAAAERIAVFYACLGLGFTGFYTGQPDYLRRKMLDCAARMRGLIDADGAARLSPDAYAHTNADRLIKSRGRGMTGIVAAMVVLAILLVAANGYFYFDSVRRLDAATDRLNDAHAAAAPAAH